MKIHGHKKLKSGYAEDMYRGGGGRTPVTTACPEGHMSLKVNPLMGWAGVKVTIKKISVCDSNCLVIVVLLLIPAAAVYLV